MKKALMKLAKKEKKVEKELKGHEKEDEMFKKEIKKKASCR